MTTPFETLSTNRLQLRKLSPEVFEYLYTHYSEQEQMDFLGLDPTSLAIEKDKYYKGFVTFNKSYLHFKIVEPESQKVIGWCGFHTWYKDHHRAEIGYGLYEEQYKQKGIMSEALKTILDFGFTQMGLHRVEAFIGFHNQASQSLVKKYGFIYEGTLREHYNVNNDMQDSLVFGLLKHEYPLEQ
jgi:ribosomal-protein-alanine N-acetyltransferase